MLQLRILEKYKFTERTQSVVQAERFCLEKMAGKVEASKLMLKNDSLTLILVRHL